jgi:hypothetical protein
MNVRLVATNTATRSIVCRAERVVTDGLSGWGERSGQGVTACLGDQD